MVCRTDRLDAHQSARQRRSSRSQQPQCGLRRPNHSFRPLYRQQEAGTRSGRYFRRKTYLPTDSPRRTATVRTTAYPCLPLFTVQPDSFHRHYADGKDTRNPYRQCHFRRRTKLLQSYGFPGILRREKPQRMALPTNKRLGRLRAEFLQRPLPNGCLPESCTQGLSAPLSCPPHPESS